MQIDIEEVVEGLERVGSRTPTVADLRLTSPDRTLSIAEQIADRLADGIIRNEIHEGSWLREIALAQRFNVSRAPIREAFRLLESDDLLELHANRGAMVSRLSRRDIWQVGLIAEAIIEPAIRVMSENWDKNVERAYVAAAERIADSARISSGADMALNMAIHSLWSNRVGIGVKLERVTRMLYRQTLRYTAEGLRDEGDRVEAAEAILAYSRAAALGDHANSTQIYLSITRKIHRRGWGRHEEERSAAVKPRKARVKQEGIR